MNELEKLTDHLFLRACRGKATERPPVWIMRQAGRYLPEYRAIRAKVDFLTLCKTPDLAAEVTLQPVDILGVDAAILFADILLILEAMGAPLRFEKGDGPVFPIAVRKKDEISRLRPLSRADVGVSLGYVFDAARTVRRALDGRDHRVPLIGFAGTPWTVSSYLVEGGTSKQFAHLLGWSYEDPAGLGTLLDLVADATLDYLLGQVEAGAQALQLFDTWGGLLDAARWRAIAEPPLARILAGVRAAAPNVPLIYYAQGASHLLSTLRDLDVDVISVDWRLPLSEARRIVGPNKVLQGNLDPAALLGPIPEIERATAAMLAEGATPAGGGHIANLGHGILQPTPVEHARAFVRAVQQR